MTEIRISFSALAVIIVLLGLGFAGYKFATHQPETFTPIDSKIGDYGN